MLLPTTAGLRQPWAFHFGRKPMVDAALRDADQPWRPLLQLLIRHATDACQEVTMGLVIYRSL